MASSRRRLVLDQSSLRRKGLPPNYLFPSEEHSTEAPADDMTQLNVLLTGANETPFSQGLWRLHLKIPEEYPRLPPKATFKTRIFHPNVEENTGAVCVETLKRDWKPELTLRDVLVTISCLLIQPNPDSALNSTAGSLLQEDYEAFARQAKLMTSIHAPIPPNMKEAIHEAKMRGEDVDARTTLQKQQQTEKPGIRPSSSSSSRASSTSSSVVMKKKAINNSASHLSSSTAINAAIPDATVQREDESSSEEEEDPYKENNPSLSPSPVTTPKLRPASPRRSALGKRPLSMLPTPIDPDLDPFSISEHNPESHMTPSEQNICANNKSESTIITEDSDHSTEPLRKSPKLSERTGTAGVNTSGRIRESSSDETSNEVDPTTHHDLTKSLLAPPQRTAEDEKENKVDYQQQSSDFSTSRPSSAATTTAHTTAKTTIISSTKSHSANVPTAGAIRPALRKTSTTSSAGSTKSGTSTGKARVGIRRL